MNEPFITISGNVATDLRVAETDTGVIVTSFRLASTPRRFDKASRSWLDMETMYFGVTSWRFLAENVRDSIRKGDPVTVTGRLRQRSWSKDGRSGVNQEITAEAIGHDLARGTSRFTKVTRTRAIPPEEQAALRAGLGLDGPVEVDPETGEVLDEPRAGDVAGDALPDGERQETAA